MRLLRNPRTRTRLGLAGVAMAAAASMVLSASPAAAAPAGADLEFHVDGDHVIQLANKQFFVKLFNNGPATAENIVVKVDVSGLDTSKLEVQPPELNECDPPSGGGKIFICHLNNDLVPGEHDNGFSPFEVTSVEDGAQPGPAGSFTVEVTSSTPDPNPNNNKKQTVAVQIAPPSIDLVGYAQDVWKDFKAKDGVAPGAKAPFIFFIHNEGTLDAKGITFKLTLPRFVSFPENEALEGCTYGPGRTVATCTYPDLVLKAGEILRFETPPNVKVAADAPGPGALSGGIVDGGATAIAPPEVNPAAIRTAAAREHVVLAKPNATQQHEIEANPKDNRADFSVYTARNPADLAVTGGSTQGTVGSTVSIPVKVRNNGPASSPNTVLKITAPTGTELVNLPAGCAFETAGSVATCSGLLVAGAEATAPFSFKIKTGTIGSNGKAEISGPLDDTNLANNSAALTITVTSGLPVTGAKVTAVAGIGAAALLVGVGLFVVARRRRVVLVTPTEDR
jgi:LPXTG-motif cell wall-anchored protein